MSVISQAQTHVAVIDVIDSTVIYMTPVGNNGVHMFTNGTVISGTREKIQIMASGLGITSDSIQKNKPRIIINNAQIKNDTVLLLNLMREYYKRSWTIVGDAGKLTFISSDGISYRSITSAMLDTITKRGKFYDFRLYLIIPATQLNVAKSAELPGNGATWGEFANKSDLILKRANGGIMIPLWNAKKAWFNSAQIKLLVDANLVNSRLTDKNFENQLGNNTWFQVDNVTESITGRVDYYQYSNFNP